MLKEELHLPQLLHFLILLMAQDYLTTLQDGQIQILFQQELYMTQALSLELVQQIQPQN